MNTPRSHAIAAPRRRQCAALLLSVILSPAVTGCSGDRSPEQPHSKYYEDILRASATTASDFQREMLKDGVLTRTEYEEAINATAKCTSDRGFQLGRTLQNGVYMLSIVASGAAERVLLECEKKYSSEVAMYFGDQLMNPDNRDGLELLVECLIHRKVLPPSYTVADYRREFANDFKNTTIKFDSPGANLCFEQPAHR
ncbi:MAG: hypothetical protein ACRC0L_00375 [Angustibacter sp.]